MMRRVFRLFLAGLLVLAGAVRAERINQEGRILGPLPVVTNAILFDTTNADAVVSAMQIFPLSNSWNENISGRPLLTNSDAMIAQIMSDLASNRRTLIAFFEMNYVLVPDSQARQTISFDPSYADQCDLTAASRRTACIRFPRTCPSKAGPRSRAGRR